MPKLALDAKRIRRYAAVNGVRTEYRDTVKKGLILRVSPGAGGSSDGGPRSYSVLYRRKVDGRRMRYGIGDATKLELAEARKEAGKVLGQVELRGDPAGEFREARKKRKSARTFEALGREYLRNPVTKARKLPLRGSTLRNWTGLFEREVVPALGSKSPGEITRGDVRDLLRRIKDGDGSREPRPTTANRTFELIRRIFSWALSEEVDGLTGSPCVGIEKLAPESERARVLSTAELRLFLDAVEADPFGYSDAALFILLTAARRSEVQGLPWRELDLDAKTWTLSADRSKSRRTLIRPLPAAALRILRDRPGRTHLATEERRRRARNARLKALLRESSSEALPPQEREEQAPVWVFPGPRLGAAVRSLQSTGTAIAERMQHLENVAAKNQKRRPVKLERWSFHDLRRTARTKFSELGIPHWISEEILGHAREKLRATYDHHTPLGEMRAALEAWATHLEEIRTPPGKRGEVVAFASRWPR